MRDGARMTLTFRVPGLPRPQPRPRFNSKTGRIYTPDTARRWREAVAWAALAARSGQGPLRGDLEVSLRFTMPDRRKADVDNLAKATLDAMVEAGVMLDDNQVTELRVSKRVGVDTGCIVEVSAVHLVTMDLTDVTPRRVLGKRAR